MKILYGFIPPGYSVIYRKTRSVSTISLITKKFQNAQWPDHMDGAVSELCNSVRQGRRHLKSKSNRTCKTYLWVNVFV